MNSQTTPQAPHTTEAHTPDNCLVFASQSERFPESYLRFDGFPLMQVVIQGQYHEAFSDRIERACNSFDALTEALEECEDYFDNHADVKDGSYGEPVANTEMRLLEVVRKALKVRK